MLLLKTVLKTPPDHRPIFQPVQLWWHNSTIRKNVTWKKAGTSSQFCYRTKSRNMETNSRSHTPRRTNCQSIYRNESEFNIPQLLQETSDMGERQANKNQQKHMHVFLPLSEDFKHFEWQRYLLQSSVWEQRVPKPRKLHPSTRGFSPTSTNRSRVPVLRESQIQST